jgi:hypothetical protein
MNFNLFDFLSTSDFIDSNLNSILLIDSNFDLLNGIKGLLKVNNKKYKIIELNINSRIKENDEYFQIYIINHNNIKFIPSDLLNKFNTKHIFKKNYYDFQELEIRLPFKFYKTLIKPDNKQLFDDYFRIFTKLENPELIGFNKKDPRPFIKKINYNNITDFVVKEFNTKSTKLKRIILNSITSAHHNTIDTRSINWLLLTYNPNRTLDCLFKILDISKNINYFNCNPEKYKNLQIFFQNFNDNQILKILDDICHFQFNDWDDLLSFYNEIMEFPKDLKNLLEIHDYLADKVFEKSLLSKKRLEFSNNPLMGLKKDYPSIFIPKNINDLILISNKFKNCVKTYYKEIEQNNSWVFTINIDSIDCCVQVCAKTGKILQCKGIRNTLINSELIFTIKRIVDKVKV